MNPQNGIIGDVTSTELPQITEDPNFLSEERKMAKYSRSSEFKRIQEHCESRIAFYQNFLPDGRMVGEATPTGEDWRVANRIIAEFNALLSSYENAKEATREVLPS